MFLLTLPYTILCLLERVLGTAAELKPAGHPPGFCVLVALCVIPRFLSEHAVTDLRLKY